MKKSTLKFSLALAAFLTLFCFGFKPAGEEKINKITICHKPPGNVENCHEITISIEAFETHMDHHDDALVCHSLSEYEVYSVLSAKSGMKLLTTFE